MLIGHSYVDFAATFFSEKWRLDFKLTSDRKKAFVARILGLSCISKENVGKGAESWLYCSLLPN